MTKSLDALRLAYGAILLLTGLSYFLPSLLPILSLQHWSDPLAARLIAAFGVSGLLAVAKFIHIAGGALLLINRMTPFALAATMPVNICAAYIAVFVERAPLLGLLSLALVAASGLLMLAHLHCYRGVLEGRELADGERAESGQNYNSVLANPFTGAPLRSYAAAAVVLLCAALFYWKVVPYTNGTTGLVTLVWPALMLLAGVAMTIARRKDA